MATERSTHLAHLSSHPQLEPGPPPPASGHQLPGLPACCLWHSSRVGKQASGGVFGGTYGAGEKARTVRAGPGLNYCCVPSSWHGAWHVLEIGHSICRMKGCALLFKGEGQQV